MPFGMAVEHRNVVDPPVTIFLVLVEADSVGEHLGHGTRLPASTLGCVCVWWCELLLVGL